MASAFNRQIPRGSWMDIPESAFLRQLAAIVDVDMSAAGIAVAISLLFGCAKVSATPLGSTADGRRQFELTCNKEAFNNGSCDEEAVALCGGSYETQSVLNSMSPTIASNGQIYVAVVGQVLLVACNARRVPVEARDLDRL